VAERPSSSKVHESQPNPIRKEEWSIERRINTCSTLESVTVIRKEVIEDLTAIRIPLPQK